MGQRQAAFLRTIQSIALQESTVLTNSAEKWVGNAPWIAVTKTCAMPMLPSGQTMYLLLLSWALQFAIF